MDANRIITKFSRFLPDTDGLTRAAHQELRRSNTPQLHTAIQVLQGQIRTVLVLVHRTLQEFSIPHEFVPAAILRFSHNFHLPSRAIPHNLQTSATPCHAWNNWRDVSVFMTTTTSSSYATPSRPSATHLVCRENASVHKYDRYVRCPALRRSLRQRTRSRLSRSGDYACHNIFTNFSGTYPRFKEKTRSK